MRIEDGGIMELINAFLETTKGFVIPAGTVLVVFSATRLAACGTESYAAEFAEAQFKVSKIMGNGVVMLHGFPILFTGTENRALMKGILDLEHWVTSVGGGEGHSTHAKTLYQAYLWQHTGRTQCRWWHWFATSASARSSWLA
jgi:uncharacterized membrane protein